MKTYVKSFKGFLNENYSLITEEITTVNNVKIDDADYAAFKAGKSTGFKNPVSLVVALIANKAGATVKEYSDSTETITTKLSDKPSEYTKHNIIFTDNSIIHYSVNTKNIYLSSVYISAKTSTYLGNYLAYKFESHLMDEADAIRNGKLAPENFKLEG